MLRKKGHRAFILAEMFSWNHAELFWNLWLSKKRIITVFFLTRTSFVTIATLQIWVAQTSEDVSPLRSLKDLSFEQLWVEDQFIPLMAGGNRKCFKSRIHRKNIKLYRRNYVRTLQRWNIRNWWRHTTWRNIITPV